MRDGSLPTSGRDLAFRTFCGTQTKSGRTRTRVTFGPSLTPPGLYIVNGGRVTSLHNQLLQVFVGGEGKTLPFLRPRSLSADLRSSFPPLYLFLQNCAWEGRENSPFMLDFLVACQ